MALIAAFVISKTVRWDNGIAVIAGQIVELTSSTAFVTLDFAKSVFAVFHAIVSQFAAAVAFPARFID